MNNIEVTIDHREHANELIVKLLSRQENFVLNISRLSYGDYLINETISVKRKTLPDLAKSIIDGHLFTQLANIKKRFKYPILI